MTQTPLFDEAQTDDGPFPFSSLNELLNYMYDMTDDPLAEAGTNVVICRGNPQSKLMVVGEAPGVQKTSKASRLLALLGKCLIKF